MEKISINDLFYPVWNIGNILILLIMFSFFSVSAQENDLNIPIGHFREFSFSKQSLQIDGENGQIVFTHYAPDIIRIRASRNETEVWPSYACIREPAGEFQFRFNSKVLIINTDSLRIEIEKYPLHLRIFSSDNKLVTEHYFGLTISWLESSVTEYHRLFPGEVFLGLGDQAGPINRRGHCFEYDGYSGIREAGTTGSFGSFIPFFIGIHDSLVYGVFLDNTGYSGFNFGAGNDEQFYSFSAADGKLDYYFISGHSVSSIISKYTYLTGRMELPPIWGLGYQHSRNAYTRSEEVLRTAAAFREKDFPADVIYLDMHSTDDNKVFTWDQKGFDHPEGLAAQLKDAGFRLAMQVSPGIKIDPDYTIYQEGIHQDHFLKYPGGLPYIGETRSGRCHFPDITKPETRTWWAKHCKSLAESGSQCIWFDPTASNLDHYKVPDIVEFEYEGKKASIRKAKNAYYLLLSRATTEGMKLQYKGERFLVLSHSGFAGIQRYAATWNGFHEGTDEYMLQGIRMMCNIGLSGVPLTGSNIGGYSGNLSSSLYLRWLNTGIYSPVFRNDYDSDTREQLPWSFGDKTETMARNIFKKRYRMLPYIYSSLYESVQTGIPLARSMALEYPFDPVIYHPDYENQFLFGSSMLIIPAKSDEKITKAYLPQGGWFQESSDRFFTGPKMIMVRSPIDSIPVFFKSGSIIPLQSPVNSTMDHPSDTLCIHIYAGKSTSSFIYYEDDGVSYKHLKGNYYKRLLEYLPNERLILFHHPSGNMPSQFRKLKLVLHGFDKMEKAEVNLRKQEIFLEKNQQIIIFDNFQDEVYIRW